MLLSNIRSLLVGHPDRSSYMAAEAYYHLKGKEMGLEPHTITLPDGSLHWFLKNPKTRSIIDVIGMNTPMDYRNAKPCAFHSKTPSKATKKFIEAIKKQDY